MEAEEFGWGLWILRGLPLLRVRYKDCDQFQIKAGSSGDERIGINKRGSQKPRQRCALLERLRSGYVQFLE